MSVCSHYSHAALIVLFYYIVKPEKKGSNMFENTCLQDAQIAPLVCFKTRYNAKDKPSILLQKVLLLRELMVKFGHSGIRF